MGLIRRTLPIILLFAAIGLNAQVFWDAPQFLSTDNSRFPQTANGSTTGVVAWQDKKTEGGWPQHWISLGVKERSGAWTYFREKIGPFSFPGEEAPIFSLAVTPSDIIYISILADPNKVDLYKSTDKGRSFQKETEFTSASTILAPKLFLNPSGKPVLLATISDETAYRVAGAFPNGSTGYSTLAPLVKDPNQILNFSPQYIVYQGREMIFFQNRTTFQNGELPFPSYQIYMINSLDQGKTWSSPRMVTDKGETDPTTGLLIEPGKFNNQRPGLTIYNGTLYMAWERSNAIDKTEPRIYFAALDNNWQVSARSVEVLTAAEYKAASPQFFTYQGGLYLFWFDNRKRNFALTLNQRNAEFSGWIDRSGLLPEQQGDSTFGRPLILDSDLYFFWENTFTTGTLTEARHNVVFMGPDRRVEAPQILGRNFKAGDRSREKIPGFTVRAEDPSGIQGYSWVWDRNPDAEAPQRLDAVKINTETKNELNQDGVWYLHVRVQDGAGNWSPSVTATYTLDTSPPAPVVIEPPSMDSEGYLTSNTVTLTWKNTDEDTTGVFWRLDYLSGLGVPVNYALAGDTSAGLYTPERRTQLNNLENGVYALTLTSQDQAGNRGEPTRFIFRVNKFRPFTIVYFVKSLVDEFSRISLEIQGRGFVSEGVVTRVILDTDGAPPWDIDLGSDRFVLSSDRVISGIKLENTPPGIYRLGVYHSGRGWSFAPASLKIDESGTVKFGDFRGTGTEEYSFPKTAAAYFFSSQAILFWIIIFFLATVFVFTGGRLIALFHEARSIEFRAHQLIKSRFLPQGLRKGVQSMAKQGLSLRVKFITSILTLTTTVILMISISLGFFITFNSQRSLGISLAQKTEVLLNSLATSAATYVPLGETYSPDLKAAGEQILLMNDAVSTVLLGPSSKGLAGMDYVYWASENQLSNLDNPKEPNIGVAKLLKDPMAALNQELQVEYEKRANEIGFQDLKTRINRLEAQADEILTRGQSPQNDAERNKIIEELRPLREDVKTRLKSIKVETRSFPLFEPEKITSGPERYIFYKPVLYSSSKDTLAYHGVVRLEVSVKNILKDIQDSQNQLIIITVIIAFAGLILALVGALILVRMTVNPIDKLVAGVKVIRDTENMKDLDGYEIHVKSKDELATLAQTINEMTHSLVKAAEAAEDLTVGKDTQKIFIPLELNKEGKKTTISHQSYPGLEFFGYYEGAKGVSGDYFSYMPLKKHKDDIPRYFSIIKCDVAGKGVPAALVMVQVATIYLNHFRNIERIQDKNFLTDLAYEINSILSSMNFYGRFAAFTVALVDQETGLVRMTNAGDSITRVYRAKTGKFETLRMLSGPGAGQIDPADMEVYGVKYVEYKVQLDHGDTLMLYTDGIEEAKRVFRDTNFNPLAFKNPDDISTKTTLDDQSGIKDEEMMPEKVDAIVEAAFKGEVFSLNKRHNPLPDLAMDFDFSRGEGSIKDVVLGLVSVEKIWRLLPDPQAGPKDRVIFDREVEAYIRKTLIQQDQFLPVSGKAEDREEYISFDRLKEDPQYDDLTILAVQRK